MSTPNERLNGLHSSGIRIHLSLLRPVQPSHRHSSPVGRHPGAHSPLNTAWHDTVGETSTRKKFPSNQPRGRRLQTHLDWNSSPFSWWWVVCCLPVITQLVVASFKANSQSPKCSHLISSHHLCLLASCLSSAAYTLVPSRLGSSLPGIVSNFIPLFSHPRPACLIYLLLLLLDSYQSDRQTDRQSVG